MLTRKNLLFLSIPVFLSGCVGSWVREGGKWRSSEDFPDIRTVPSREEEKEMRKTDYEKLENKSDLKALEQIREQMKARDEALREKIEAELDS